MLSVPLSVVSIKASIFSFPMIGEGGTSALFIWAIQSVSTITLARVLLHIFRRLRRKATRCRQERGYSLTMARRLSPSFIPTSSAVGNLLYLRDTFGRAHE